MTPAARILKKKTPSYFKQLEVNEKELPVQRKLDLILKDSMPLRRGTFQKNSSVTKFLEQRKLYKIHTQASIQ
jgi:hypothetical protein